MADEGPGYRRWWRRPRRTGDREEHRQVSFLELFYDLVYVVVIAEIAHFLAGHVDAVGVLEATFLFALVWMAWFNGTIYHDIHSHNDLRTRVFTFAQMFAVAAMAVFAHNAFGEGAVGFALSFAAFQTIVGFLWWRTGVHDPDHRPLSAPYSLAIFLSAALFAVSAFVADPVRPWLWMGAFLFMAGSPLPIYLRRSDDPAVVHQVEVSLRLTHSAVERFGLFTIIVLGEVIVGVVQGVASHEQLSWTVGVTAALGMTVAIGLWWLYFDFVSHRLPTEGRATVFTWFYTHLSTTLGIVMAGAAILNLVEHAGEPTSQAVRWLLIGSVATVAISVAVTMRTLRLKEEIVPLYRTGSRLTLACGLVLIALGFARMDAIPLLAAVLALLLLPVLHGIKVWIKVLGAKEIPLA